MKTIKNIKLWAVAVLVSLVTTTTAQTLHTGYFLESMVQRHEMNAAFGGESNYFMLPAVGGLQFGISSNVGLSNYVFERNGQMVTALSPQVTTADFMNRLPAYQNIHADMDVPLLSVGFRAFGGFNTVVLKSRSMVDVSIPSTIMEFIKQGQDPTTGIAHYDVDNLALRAVAFTELALGHSRKIDAVEGLSLGAKVKLMLGSVNAQMNMEHIGIDLSGSRWTITSQGSAQLSHNIDIEENTNGEITSVAASSIISDCGLGFDFGAVYTPAVLPNLTVSLALNDIGFIAWRNMSNYASNKAYEYTGFDNIGSDNEALDEQLDDMLNSIEDIIKLEDAGVRTRTLALNTVLNIGAEYAILNRKISFGILSSTRFAGNFTYAEGMAVVNFRPLSWLHLAVNGSYSTYGGALGALINICPNGFNLFLGCDYISPTMKFNSSAVPVNPVNANFRLGIAFPFGKK